MRTFLKTIAAIIVAAFMSGVLIVADASDNAVIVTFFCVGIMAAAMLGVFDEKKRKDTEHESIRHYDGRRGYGQAAAVFMGTACLYMGTPQQCEDVADDLWHYGQQAEVRALDGTETFDVL